MSTLVVEIFNRHLGDMKFQFGETIIQMKPIHVCLILGLRVSPIANEFLFVNPEHMKFFRTRRFPKKKNTYVLKEIVDALKLTKLERHQAMMPSETDMQQDLVQEAMRYQIEAPAIGTPAVGSSSFDIEIGVVVVKVCSQLEEHVLYHLEILHSLGITSSLLLRNCKMQARTKKEEDGKRKKAEPRIKKGKGEWQKKAEEADVPNKKKKVEGPKKEALTDEQFDHVPLIQLKALIPKILKKGLANIVPRKRRVQFPKLQNIQPTAKNLLQQVTSGEILEVANTLMWKKGEEKDIADKKDVEEKVKSEEEEVQEYLYTILHMEESKNGYEKVDDAAEEEDSEQSTVVVYYTEKKDVQPDNETMVVAELAKTDIVFFNQEEVVGETYQTLEVEKAKDEASQTKESKEDLEQNKEEVFEDKEDDDGNSQNKPDPEQLVLMESEVDVTLKKRHTLTEEEINESAFKMACKMNRLHAHLDELLPGVLLESSIQRLISLDMKNQVGQVWSLRKDELFLKAKKSNRSTYMMIGEKTACLNALYTLYPNQWLGNEVIEVYIKALIQYFDTQH
ncbi:hypothetical protein GIB67_023193 [Kingdonia uniflora]|uniref:Uncharacterized protein n=1 Tax=Kingdonia uniflora TaxID=39325 RepID=A0A7J7MCA0_9MAGN|nr:hypothetical protein GIB67_023193 [Kingdonia uniflora]